MTCAGVQSTGALPRVRRERRFMLGLTGKERLETYFAAQVHFSARTAEAPKKILFDVSLYVSCCCAFLCIFCAFSAFFLSISCCILPDIFCNFQQFLCISSNFLRILQHCLCILRVFLCILCEFCAHPPHMRAFSFAFSISLCAFTRILYISAYFLCIFCVFSAHFL